MDDDPQENRGDQQDEGEGETESGESSSDNFQSMEEEGETSGEGEETMTQEPEGAQGLQEPAEMKALSPAAKALLRIISFPPSPKPTREKKEPGIIARAAMKAVGMKPVHHTRQSTTEGGTPPLQQPLPKRPLEYKTYTRRQFPPPPPT